MCKTQHVLITCNLTERYSGVIEHPTSTHKQNMRILQRKKIYNQEVTKSGSDIFRLLILINKVDKIFNNFDFCGFISHELKNN